MLHDNDISDTHPRLQSLTNLKMAKAVNNNDISDLSPLDGLRENITLIVARQSSVPKRRTEDRGTVAMGRVPGERDLKQLDSSTWTY